MRVTPPEELIPVSEIDVIELPDNDLTRKLVDLLREAQVAAHLDIGGGR